jgi:hypothetical protein
MRVVMIVNGGLLMPKLFIALLLIIIGAFIMWYDINLPEEERSEKIRSTLSAHYTIIGSSSEIYELEPDWDFLSGSGPFFFTKKHKVSYSAECPNPLSLDRSILNSIKSELETIVLFESNWYIMSVAKDMVSKKEVIRHIQECTLTLSGIVDSLTKRKTSNLNTWE